MSSGVLLRYLSADRGSGHEVVSDDGSARGGRRRRRFRVQERGEYLAKKRGERDARFWIDRRFRSSITHIDDLIDLFDPHHVDEHVHQPPLTAGNAPVGTHGVAGSGKLQRCLIRFVQPSLTVLIQILRQMSRRTRYSLKGIVDASAGIYIGSLHTAELLHL